MQIRKFTFRWRYFVLSIILFLVEIFIAVFIKDNFFRPYFGDFLVVILLYCLIRSFFKIPVLTVAIIVLLFAITIELLQYMNLLNFLQWQDSGLAKTVLGNHFDSGDIAAYTLGIIFVIAVEVA